jgi:hypothetical protein
MKLEEKHEADVLALALAIKQLLALSPIATLGVMKMLERLDQSSFQPFQVTQEQVRRAKQTLRAVLPPSIGGGH